MRRRNLWDIANQREKHIRADLHDNFSCWCIFYLEREKLENFLGSAKITYNFNEVDHSEVHLIRSM